MAGRLLPVIVAIVVAISASTTLAFRDRVPDCSAIISKSTFETYKHVCAALGTDKNVERETKFSLENKWDIIETCTCDLLSHELAWTAMLTHPAESMYVALVQLIDQVDSAEGAKIGVPKDSAIFTSSSEGERLYYWDRLDDILNNQQSDQEEYDNLSTQFNAILAKVYYDPVKFAIQFQGKNAHTGTIMKRFVSDTCNSLLGNMGKFLVYFDKLRKMAENDRYLFRVTAYNEDLHKIRMVLNYCKTMGAQSILI